MPQQHPAAQSSPTPSSNSIMHHACHTPHHASCLPHPKASQHHCSTWLEPAAAAPHNPAAPSPALTWRINSSSRRTARTRLPSYTSGVNFKTSTKRWPRAQPAHASINSGLHTHTHIYRGVAAHTHTELMVKVQAVDIPHAQTPPPPHQDADQCLDLHGRPQVTLTECPGRLLAYCCWPASLYFFPASLSVTYSRVAAPVRIQFWDSYA
jgi:hypothetical protein